VRKIILMFINLNQKAGSGILPKAPPFPFIFYIFVRRETIF